MPIIIDEFEILVAPTPAPREEQDEGQRQSPRPLRPDDITDIIRQARERDERLRAH